MGIRENGISGRDDDASAAMRHSMMPVPDLKLETKSDTIEPRRDREDHNRTADGAGHRVSEARFREPPIPAAKAK